jgi:hypothetical protein
MASRRDRDEQVDNARLGLLEAAEQGPGCTPVINQANLVNASADGPTDCHRHEVHESAGKDQKGLVSGGGQPYGTPVRGRARPRCRMNDR